MQVGGLPLRRIPVHVAVHGSPLVLQRERVLVRGLQPARPQLPQGLQLAFGRLPRGQQVVKQVYVHNTGERPNQKPPAVQFPPPCCVFVLLPCELAEKASITERQHAVCRWWRSVPSCH